MPKKLYRSNSDKMVAGVCAGIAKYFRIDPTIVRLIVAAIMLSGSGFVAYLVAAIVIPLEPEYEIVD